MKYDVIIIGTGLGGLVAGAKLSKEGKKVLLIEQHNKAGGCATTFRRRDFNFEVGLHEMDGLHPRDMKTKIFRDLDVLDKVEFITIPEFYRFTNGRYNITIPHQVSQAIETLLEVFPDENDGIRAYFDQIIPVRGKKAGSEQDDTNIGEFLDSIIKNEDLKLALLGNLGYFGDDPYSLSLRYYSVAQGSYYTGGSSYIKGGSQKLSDHLAGYILKHGGEILFNHLVTGLKTRDRRITGVIYKKKRDHDSAVMEAETEDMIANNSIPGLADLLPEQYGSLLNEQISGMEYGASLLTLYLGFNKAPRDLGNQFYSTCMFDPSVKTQADIKTNNRDDFSRRSFIFVDYSQIDSDLSAPCKGVGGICCIDYPDDWDGLDRKEYLLKKEEAASLFIERLEKLIPGISSHIDHHETATSLTVRRYTLNPGGAVYGFAQTPGKKVFDPQTILDNLHIASAWGKTGGGFSGAIYGGYLCAFNILRQK